MSGQSLSVTPTATPASLLLARHALGRDSATFDAVARARLLAFIFDTLAVGVAGAASPYAPAVRNFALRQSGAPEAQVWGFADRLDRRQAAFCNAFLAHCQEFDCVHEAAVLHPFTVVTPVICAEAEAESLSRETCLAAIAAGVDVAAGLGVAATTPIKFFRPAVYGLFGAVAALARARSLSEAVTAHAFGYALAFASGTMQAHSEGTPALAVQIANAARCAFDAVDLASSGLPGPIGSIDGGHGLLTLFETGHDLSRLLDPLASTLRVQQVSWKPFPTGRAAHAGLEMAQAIHRAGISASDIERVEFRAPPLILHLVGRPVVAPLEINYARLCLPFLAASMIRRGALDLGSFSQDALADPATHDLAARITVSANTIVDPAAFTPQTMHIILKSGALHEERVDQLPGSPVRPLSLREQLEKARRCFDFSMGHGGEDRARMLSDVLLGPIRDDAFFAMARLLRPAPISEGVHTA